ncbi:hypothetical protein RAC90_20005 [Pantoea sp. CS_6]|uniref:hypothetical protein n=1 Tax=unclassified Pantoea TaxID=2630326 RepID=UPI0035BFE890
MLKYWLVWGSLFALLMIFMGSIPFSPFEKWWFTANFMSNVGIIKAFLAVLILCLVAYLLIIGAAYKRYSFKIEQLNFGGVNILFDNSDILFKKTIKNYLDTKRSLFKLDAHHDAFDEVLNSYFECYNFIRTEIRILNLKRQRDRELYNVASEALKVLNVFLTEHQNNYRRWHKYVSEKDSVLTQDKNSDGDFISLSYHLTPIGKVQSYYYHFNKILDGFSDVNKFFSADFANKFNIDIKKWS